MPIYECNSLQYNKAIKKYLLGVLHMKNLSEKILSFILSLAMVVSVLCGVPMTAHASTSVSWNFKDTGFKDLGTISSNVTVNNLTLLANSLKTMTVQADSQTVSGTAYTYALALGGSGSTSYRAVKIPVTGTDTIKVICRSTGTSARTLAVANASGTQLGTITAGTTAAQGTYNYSGSAGYVYIYSTNSGISIYKIQVDSQDTTSSGSTSESTTDTSDGTVVSSYSALVSAVTAAQKAGGGIVYVKGTSIACSAQLALSASSANVSIVGVKNSDGTYPILDFSSFRSSYIGKSTSDSQVGIRITGSKYTIKNLIIQKAPDNGIQIKGSNANYNTVENCIVRYNNDAGVQITGGASYNTMKFVYSYRNCDIYTLGGNADGFAPKLGATTGNSFYECYAWDNSDDGWDSYDKTDGLTYDLSYEWCACWNNGNPDVFTGKYDYDNGASLDTDLFLVELITATDSSFATNYKNGKFSLPTSSFLVTNAGTISASSWAGSNYAGNPNGFKFGSVNTTSNCVRTVKNCLSFDHASKGFDNNNSSVTANFTNTVSFGNGYNYAVAPFTFKTWTNVQGFLGSSNDKLPSGYSVTTPSSSKQSTIKSTAYSTRDSIVNSCNADKIPGSVYFNVFG